MGKVNKMKRTDILKITIFAVQQINVYQSKIKELKLIPGHVLNYFIAFSPKGSSQVTHLKRNC